MTPVKPVHKADPADLDRRDPEQIDRAHLEAIEAGLADMRSGSLASDQEIDEAFSRFGRTSR